MSEAVAPAGANFQMQVLLSEADWSAHLEDKTREGLAGSPPWIPPVWFYDEVGSKLFEQITVLPEYYPTRAERSILRQYSDEIVQLAGVDTFVELGAGSSEKTRLLLSAGLRRGRLERFVPVDCSETFLAACSADLANAFPGLEIQGVVADFTSHLGHLVRSDARMVMFLGSTIGNFDPQDRAEFLREIAADQGDNDCFLLGTDLVKSPERLIAAYDDRSGVTAEFNLNALNVLNRQLSADFDTQAFRHRAVWNPGQSRIEMHLVATRRTAATVGAFDGFRVEFAQHDHLLTEYSTKFTPDQIARELADVGLAVAGSWTDPDGDFLVTLARRP